MSETRAITSRILKTELVEWRKLSFLQQDTFKDLSSTDKEKLRNSIIHNEFAQPFYVWYDIGSEIIYCLDGYHRSRMMQELIIEGHDIPEQLPATFVFCKDVKEAAKMVLVYSSVYAKVTESGFNDFVQSYQIDLQDVLPQINIPDLDLKFKESDKLIQLEDDHFNEDDELRKILNATSNRGDVFQLGDHILICGDSRHLHQYESHLKGKQVKVIYCDPPYNISYNYESGLNPGGRKYTNKSFSDSLTDFQYQELIRSTLNNGLAYCGKDAHVFYWCDESYIWLIQDAFREENVKSRRVCFWIKDRLNPVPQIAFNKVIEPCVYGTFGTPALNDEFTALTEVWNSDINTSHSLDDLMTIAQLWMVPRQDTSTYQHPTTKPITLHEKPLKRCSVQGDVVMDLFGGSGSTLISCEQLKRRAILVEQDPVFCDVIIRRYASYCIKKGIEVSFKHCNGQMHLNSFLDADQSFNN
jgi:DNA modification methylase